jgi:selenoprotein W-related protein
LAPKQPLATLIRAVLPPCGTARPSVWRLALSCLIRGDAGIGRKPQVTLHCSPSREAHAIAPNVTITYCRLCGWLLRAAWMAQELLSTFAEELGSVTLVPDDTGGVFEVRLDGNLLWSRSAEGRFPESKELKQLVRDQIAPARDLGHVDSKHR